MCVQANGQSTGSTSASKLSAGYDWVLMEADTGMETELRAGTDGGRLHPYEKEVDFETLIILLNIFISLCSFAYASVNILGKVATDPKFFCAFCKLYHRIWPLCGLVFLSGYLHLSPQLPLLLL
ncbi:uncharacterized [Tachysurus ichikawai]